MTHIKRIAIFLLTLAASATSFAVEPPLPQIRTTRPGANVTFERSLADGKALVSVVDAKQEAVLGLTAADFTVARPDAAAKVISAESIARSVEVPRHVVLVLDNSYSMVERKAIPKLLEGVGAVLKHIRPIDDARIVVFSTKPVKMGGHDLHVETFKSNKTSELEAFVAKAYKKEGITETTVLYEAMLAGLELIRGTPADDPRFLIVFSDGEDINSAFKSDVVSQAAQGVPNFRVFAIDYMEGPKIDEFLASFAGQHRGEARKAGTGADLLTLFQRFASRIDNFYVVSYAFAPVAGPTAKPTEPPAQPAAPAPVAKQPAATAAPEPAAAPAAQPTATPVPAAPPAAPEAPSSNWWLWVLLLIVLILIIFFMTRKSDENKK